MQKLKKLLLVIVSVLSVNLVNGQTFMFHSIPKDSTQIEISYLHPFFDSNIDMSIISGVFDLSFNIPLKQKLNLFCSVPFMTFSFDYESGYGNYSLSGAGNIFLGMQLYKDHGGKNKSIGTFGFYLPSSWLIEYGYLTNALNPEKYLHDRLTISVNFAHHRITDNGFRSGVELGPDFMIITNSENSDDNDFIIHYGLSMGVQQNNIDLSAELYGIGILTAEKSDDKFFHALSFGISYLSQVSPSIFYKIYLEDELQDWVDGVLGLKLNYSLGSNAKND
ncbi:MAG: hypothetical protein JXR46_10400 [Calditrichaceae bacterium]|nr:hypothetical protein [Calditrichaceae bacterium]RQV92962.1 MAG: hypothetical protein EH224_13815 [Calditrichota bacterium]